MSIKDWKNGRKFNLRDADIEDLFEYDEIAQETNIELKELEFKRNQNKINQAR